MWYNKVLFRRAAKVDRRSSDPLRKRVLQKGKSVKRGNQ